MFRQLVSVVAVTALVVHIVLLSGTAAVAFPLKGSASEDSSQVDALGITVRGCVDPLNPNCCEHSGC
ncbi:hypothetical protein PM082_000515 [Marasmius tenuissimus]|nr:hypothetical protein PM082_000515 [Marasmius tenuissimus]